MSNDYANDEDWPSEISQIELFNSFYNNHDQYLRYHVHLMGLVPTKKTGEDKDPIRLSKGIGQRKNKLGFNAKIDANPDPYCLVETQGGDETGSTTYFPIGVHKYLKLKDSNLPLWDSKTVLLGKKDTVTGIKFTIKDENAKRKDEFLCDMILSSDDFPEVSTSLEDDDNEGGSWKEYRVPVESSSDRIKNDELEWLIYIKITDCNDRVVTKEISRNLYESTEERSYTEEIIVTPGASGEKDNSLLQCWRLPNSNKAVLWILGRNDCFMHPHVAQQLFWNHGYDLYVLNYKMNGKCRKKGWVESAHFISHNYTGNFDVYNDDIQQALDLIHGYKTYDKTLGYAHSTGAPILLNYLMEYNDEGFTGFVFNSPFLDWGYVGGDMVELVLENMDWITNLSMGKMNMDSKVGVATTPKELASTPINYLNEEIVLGDWYAKFWTMYYFDWCDRPLYHVPMTTGFAQGVTKVHRKLEECHKKLKRPVTTKPFLVITARGDDVLCAPETLSRADWIGPNRWEMELNHNSHDIFLSADKSDTDMAIELVEVWLKQRRFY